MLLSHIDLLCVVSQYMMMKNTIYAVFDAAYCLPLYLTKYSRGECMRVRVLKFSCFFRKNPQQKIMLEVSESERLTRFARTRQIF